MQYRRDENHGICANIVTTVCVIMMLNLLLQLITSVGIHDFVTFFMTVLLAWSTGDFEFFAAFDPLAEKVCLIKPTCGRPLTQPKFC